MNYKDHKPIYQQIIDYCLKQIGNGTWRPGERLPSMRELCVTLQVNNRTLLRATDELERMGLITAQRGQGYFCTNDAKSRLLIAKRMEFDKVVISELLEAMEECGYTLEETLDRIEFRYNNPNS